MPTQSATWLALAIATMIAMYLGFLIWRHEEPPAGAFAAFAAFCALPILVLSGPELLPKLIGHCATVEGKDYCLSELAREMKKVEAVAQKADDKATSTSDAVKLQDSVVPIIPPPGTSTSTVAQNKCHPYTYTNGLVPSAGLVLIGQGKTNWFPVVSSIYDKNKALEYAKEISGRSKYPVHVYQAKDNKGRLVFAVTLEGYLSQDEAVARTCYAQGEGDLANDAYTWATDKWEYNIR